MKIDRAFVISPIGTEGHELHDHANWVRKNIIDKACQRVLENGHQIEVKRSDDYIHFERITQEIFERIVRDRIIFVILGGDRPNCYFELGLAIAAGRPVILLKHDRESSHFDTKDYRATIEYALPSDLGAPASERDIEKVAAAIIDRLERPHHQPLVHDLYDPLGRNLVELQILPKFRDLSLDEYAQFFLESDRRIGLMGMSLEHFTSNTLKNFKSSTQENLIFFEFLKSKILFFACDVSIVLMHESNPALAHLHRLTPESHLKEDVKTTRDAIRNAYRKWMRFKTQVIDPAPSQRADGRKGSLRIVQVRHGIVHYRLSFNEKEMILSPYINSAGGYNSHGPAMRVAAASPFYQHTVAEYDDLIRQNPEVDEPSDARSQ